MKNAQIKIFVINLRRSVQRKSAIENIMNKYSIDFEFFDAVDGESLSSEVIEKSRERSDKWYKENEGGKASMKLGEIGVSISHFKIYKKIIEENIEYAIITEDDVLLDDRLKKFISYVQKIKSLMGKFDLVLLGYCTNDLNYNQPAICSYWGRMKISNEFRVGIPVKWYWSAIGYLINRRGASLLSNKQGEYPCLTADILTANSPMYGVKLGILNKPIIWPGELNNLSTIEAGRNVEIEMIKLAKKTSPTSSGINLKKNLSKLKHSLQIKKLKLKINHYSFISDRY